MHDLLRKRLVDGNALRIKVIPKSPRTEIIGEMGDGTIKIRVAAPAERGKANAELCSFLEKETGGKVDVISGQTSTLKLIRIR